MTSATKPNARGPNRWRAKMSIDANRISWLDPYPTVVQALPRNAFNNWVEEKLFPTIGIRRQEPSTKSFSGVLSEANELSSLNLDCLLDIAQFLRGLTGLVPKTADRSGGPIVDS